MERNYTMITIYQIQLTDEQIDQVNTFGHDAVPAQKAKLKAMFGSKNFNPVDFEYYTPTMKVDTDDLDKAYELTNLWYDESKIERLGPYQSSSSVGDIFQVGSQFYIVDTFGFTPIYFNDEICEVA
jgi:hypothetical protein